MNWDNEKTNYEKQSEARSTASCVPLDLLVMPKNSFTYVNITTNGCEGWLNLFFGEYCIQLVNDVLLADKIREEIPEKA